MGLDYKIANEYSNVRRENRKDFVDNIKGNKKNNVAILSIHFNNSGNIKKLLDYLFEEDKQNFDIILIENSTKDDEENKFVKYCEGKNNITIIKPINNLGSAGGYSLGMEYIINKEYKYFFVVEDDVDFLEKNVFSDMREYANNETLTFIHNCKNTRTSSDSIEKGKSRWVQIAGYPIEFIEKVGIIDPRYFFRGEDLERGSRIEKGIKKHGYKIKIADHDYLHPYLKSVNGNYTWFYFSIRNQLLSLKKNPKNNCQFFVVLFFYLWTAISKFLIKRDSPILRSFMDAICDFLKHDFSRKNNKNKIEGFLKYKSDKEKVEWMDEQKLSDLSKNFYSNTRLLCITGIDLEKLNYSNNIWNFWKYGILISSSSTIFYPISLLARQIICINEFNLLENKISISQYNNWNTMRNLIGIVVSFIASAGLIIIVNFIIILSIGLNKGLRRK